MSIPALAAVSMWPTSMISTSCPRKLIRLPRPMPHQLPVLLHSARMKVAVCGRRWGKTALGLMCTVGGHGAYRGQRPGAVQGAKVWWVAPSHPIASEIWRDLKHSTRGAWSHKDEVERRIELPSGGSVTVRSAVDPETLVAVGLDGLVIDEAAKCKEQVWDMLRPALADRKGWCLFIGTPKGFNWFYSKFEYARQAEGWACWQRPSSDNPLMTPEELAKARLDAPLLYGQEYEARFEQPEGAEWPASAFEHGAFWFDEWPQNANWACKTIAIDPSKGRHDRQGDFSPIIKFGVTWEGREYCEADLKQGRPVDSICADAAQAVKDFQPDGLYLEPALWQDLMAQPLREAMKNLGVETTIHLDPDNAPKHVRIRRLTECIMQRKIAFLANHRGTIICVQQLRAFGPEIDKEHDDGPDGLEMARRLAIKLLRKGKK